MVNESQQREIDKKILMVVRDFCTNGGSIQDVSNRTGISSSSVQRYLNNQKIITLLGQVVYDSVQAQLQMNKQNGLSRGGINSTNNYEALRDSEGHFIGNVKR